MKHFILGHIAETETYKPITSAIKKTKVPPRDRQQHGTSLLQQVSALLPDMQAAKEAQEQAGLEDGFGLVVEFESFPDIALAFESLERVRSGIELLNVRHVEYQELDVPFARKRTYATVYVPEGKLAHFESLIQEYLEEKRDRSGHPRDHRTLIDAIEQIRTASLTALWTDETKEFPQTDDESIWWEVWLPIRGNREATLIKFSQLAEAQGFQMVPGRLEFPERTVLLISGTAGQMKRSMMTLNSIAELRRAKETANFFDSLRPEEQPAWMEELLERCDFPGINERVPHVCLLDTGVNNGHPLIQPALANTDMHTVEPTWDLDDTEGHGTAMAGVALAGNLAEILDSNEAVEIGHRLESVKLIPQNRGNAGDPHFHGSLTIEAVARPEITAPHRNRVFGMAVTAKDARDRGRPSAWSSAIDGLAFDADRRLIVVSAGNIDDPNAWAEYPVSNSTDGIHDPGQAWNALTVGACTHLVDAGSYRPIAKAGGLSPFSTTSSTWQPNWPLKPDVVFEGGNAANDGLGAVWMSSLSLLTANNYPSRDLFTTIRATSAATALGSGMAAKIMSVYPELWSETIRGLVVHSARWTDAMRSMFLPPRNPSKKDFAHMVRHCGFGEPDLERALWSVSNSLTLVVQESLRPFKREGTKDPTLRDMHLYRLPWPLDELEQLGETDVEMRVTLSYFIEPNPSRRGQSSKYSYHSHGLRFDVRRPLESDDDFRARINAVARDEDEGTKTTNRGDDLLWTIGKQNRHKGSVHSDIWKGQAVDLARRGVLAVYPTAGWWKTRTKLERYDLAARYALLVSIHAPEVDVDLYTAVANQIATPVMVET